MTQISINEALEKARTEKKESLDFTRTFLKCTEAEFTELMRLKCERIFNQRGEKTRPFEVDKDNQEFIHQLYLYAIGSEQFSGDIRKGLFVWGGYGAGKTALLFALSEIITEMTVKNVSKFAAKVLAERMNEEGVENMAKRPLFIDDLGREPELFNNFGTKKRVMVDLLARRYDTGAWTFVTAQYPIPKFNDKYGMLIVDRMRAMFNEIELPGQSRRK
ncbi:MAG: hypothetical protein ACK5JD_06245 [Mangrovibacterium sp.]